MRSLTWFNSDKVEDMEPDWVEHVPCLTGVGEAISIGNSLYSAFNTSISVGSMSQSDFHYYAEQRGLQLVDWEMHKDVAVFITIEQPKLIRNIRV